MHRQMRIAIMLCLFSHCGLWLASAINFAAQNNLMASLCGLLFVGSAFVCFEAWRYLSGVMEILGDECDGWE